MIAETHSSDDQLSALKRPNLKLGHKLAAVMGLMLTAMLALSFLSFAETRTSALDDRALMTRRAAEIALEISFNVVIVACTELMAPTASRV